MLHRVAALRDGGLTLVLGGAGGVGTALLDLARKAGAHSIGVASAGKYEVVAAFVGSHVDHAAADYSDRLRRAVNTRVDVVFDPIGGTHLRRGAEVR